MYTHTTDRTTNLLISSNVQYVHLGGDKHAIYENFYLHKRRNNLRSP